MCVWELPLFRHDLRMCVSLESRYGMCDLSMFLDFLIVFVVFDVFEECMVEVSETQAIFWFSVFSCLFFRDWITLPRADRDLLMYFASVILFMSFSPSIFSLPARSTKVNCESNIWPSLLFLSFKFCYPYMLPPINEAISAGISSLEYILT